MKRTVLMIAAVTIAASLTLNASANLTDFMPSFNTFDYMPYIPPMIPQSMIGMPSFNIYDYMPPIPAPQPYTGPVPVPGTYGWDCFQSVMLDRAIDRTFWGDMWDLHIRYD